MALVGRFHTRPDGITEIRPDPKNAFNAIQSTIKPLKTFHQKPAPFILNHREKSDLPYCLRGFIPHTSDVELDSNGKTNKITLGLLLYEITPATSGFVYVATSPFYLSNLETDIFQQFADYESYKHHIINDATDYITRKKGKLEKNAIIHLRNFLHNATSYDYTVDFLLLPSVFPDYGIDIEYYRPNSVVWGELFDNVNCVQLDHRVPKTLLAYVENVIDRDLPQMNTNTFTGLEQSCLLSSQGFERHERRKYARSKDYGLIKSIRTQRLLMG